MGSKLFNKKECAYVNVFMLVKIEMSASKIVLKFQHQLFHGNIVKCAQKLSHCAYL